MYDVGSFGQNLGAERKRKRLTQEQLSDAIGVTPSMLARWERGEAIPRADKVCLAADVLGVGLDQLIDRK